MSVFTPLSLGQPIPDSPHGVSCSLPTLRSVRGYEEKNPEIVQHLTSGYPRFVVHPFAQELATQLAPADRKLWLVSSGRMAEQLAAWLAQEPEADPALFVRDGLHGVSHPPSADVAGRAKLFLQHVGGFLSSREAEDALVRLGLRPAIAAEPAFAGDPAAEVHRHLRTVLAAADRDLLLANSGANAVYAAFRALSEMQAREGRTHWLQLGWLYMDTIAVLKKFTAGPGDYLHQSDVFDFAALERLFAERGARMAGVVVEIPTNPLVQTPDLPRLAALCRQQGVALLIDPSVASVFSVDVLAYGDAVVTSLTKYTASDGDVLAGLVAINADGPRAEELRRRTAAWIEAPYPRDLSRLAEQIGRTREVLARIESNLARVAAFLGSHPKVSAVHWALHPASQEVYQRLARHPHATGGMISFSVRGGLDRFYDRVRLPKGPSFGMKTSLLCPFMFLAHYDLVTTAEGRAELAESGLDPELLRLAVGAEPIEAILGALAEALA